MHWESLLSRSEPAWSRSAWDVALAMIMSIARVTSGDSLRHATEQRRLLCVERWLGRRRPAGSRAGRPLPNTRSSTCMERPRRHRIVAGAVFEAAEDTLPLTA